MFLCNTAETPKPPGLLPGKAVVGYWAEDKSNFNDVFFCVSSQFLKVKNDDVSGPKSFCHFWACDFKAPATHALQTVVEFVKLYWKKGTDSANLFTDLKYEHFQY